MLICHQMPAKRKMKPSRSRPLISSIVLPNITYALSVQVASESELTIAQQFLDRCFKPRYISKKLEIGELLKVQDHKICRKVSSISNHPLRANFPETKITRYRNKSPAMPAIYTDRFKNTFFNRIVFKYNVACKQCTFCIRFLHLFLYILILFRGILM